MQENAERDLILITKDDCKQCDWVKGKIPEGLNVLFLDHKNTNAVMYLAYNEILVDTPFPVLILPDDVAVTGTVKIKNTMRDFHGQRGNG